MSNLEFQLREDNKRFEIEAREVEVGIQRGLNELGNTLARARIAKAMRLLALLNT